VLVSSRPRRAGISENAAARDHGDRRPFHAGKRGQITVQVQWDWVGRPGRTMTVKGIEDVPVHD
jgi:hypothetical protein